MSRLDTIDFDELVEICEGADNTAELLLEFICNNPQEDYADETDRRDNIAHDFATYMNGFWDEGNDVDEEEHWDQNYEWGLDLLNEILES